MEEKKPQDMASFDANFDVPTFSRIRRPITVKKPKPDIATRAANLSSSLLQTQDSYVTMQS